MFHIKRTAVTVSLVVVATAILLAQNQGRPASAARLVPAVRRRPGSWTASRTWPVPGMGAAAHAR